jgi:hypothetical protein
MKLKLAVFGLLMVLAIPPVRSQEITALSRPAGDDNTKYTNVGNIAITITNFGTLGHGFRLWPQQPSFQYPRGSGIEHMFIGGIWIGGYHPSNGIRVSTAAVDVSSLRPGAAEGFEFTTGIDSRVVERSTLPDNRFYLPGAVSHQDFVADFTDTNTVNPNQNSDLDPEPRTAGGERAYGNVRVQLCLRGQLCHSQLLDQEQQLLPPGQCVRVIVGGHCGPKHDRFSPYRRRAVLQQGRPRLY